MSELFDDISCMVGGPMPRRRVIRLAARALAGSTLAALWPRRVKAYECNPAATTFPGCNTNFDIQAKGSVEGYGCSASDLSAACAAAKQGVQNAATAFSCPAACPVLELQTAPQYCICEGCHATGNTGLGGEIVRKDAVATGTYRCVCPPPRTVCNGVCCAKACDANGRCPGNGVSPVR
jgi:hypothetical protein